MEEYPSKELLKGKYLVDEKMNFKVLEPVHDTDLM